MTLLIFGTLTSGRGALLSNEYAFMAWYIFKYRDNYTYDSVSKSFRTELITKYTLTIINTRWEATQRIMAAKLIRLSLKIPIQLHLVAANRVICSSRSRRPVWKLLDALSYIYTYKSAFRNTMCFISGACFRERPLCQCPGFASTQQYNHRHHPIKFNFKYTRKSQKVTSICDFDFLLPY
jgi:hypothetical protein